MVPERGCHRNQGEYAFPEEQFEDSLSETCQNVQNLLLFALSDQQGEEEIWSWGYSSKKYKGELWRVLYQSS